MKRKVLPVITARDIEIAVARFFGSRLNICVPNVSWGFLRYEADMLVIRPTGYCDEVEIKVTKSDLRADFKKYHWHDDPKVKRLWFALPPALADEAVTLLPAGTGILVVTPESPIAVSPRHPEGRAGYFRVTTLRAPKATLAKPLTAQQIAAVARLGCMRIWTLKAECKRWKDLYDDARREP